MAWQLSDLDTTHFTSFGPSFTDGTYVFMADPGTGMGQVVVYKIENGLLNHLFSHPVDFVTYIHFDGTYLACTCGPYGIKIYSFSESGLTLVDEAFDPIPGAYFTYFLGIDKDESETEDIWHVTCIPGGFQSFKLIGGSLTRVAYELTYYIAYAIRSANNVLYLGFNSTTDTLSIYEFTGSSYNLLNGINLSSGIAGVDNIDNKIWIVFGGSGIIHLFEHDLTYNTLTELDSIIKGTCTGVSTNSTTCFAGNTAGNYGFEYIDGSIVEVETDDTGLLSMVGLSSTDRWIVFSGDGGLYLYELGEPVIIPDFRADKTVGSQYLDVQFIDLSEADNITDWYWVFGDGGTSTEQNPSYFYSNPGIYTVSLNITVNGTTYTETKVQYITIKSKYTYDIATSPNMKAYLYGTGSANKLNVGVKINAMNLLTNNE